MEWDEISVLLNLVMVDSNCKQIAALINNIPDETLPEPIFERPSGRLKASAVSTWKSKMEDVFARDAERLLREGKAEDNMASWAEHTKLIALLHKKIDEADDQSNQEIRKREKRISKYEEHPAEYKASLESGRDPIAAAKREIEREEEEMRKLNKLKKDTLRIQALYSFKAELLQRAIHVYESSGVLPKWNQKGQKRRNQPSPRMIERAKIACSLLDEESHDLIGREELNAALQEREGKVGDLVKGLDKAIDYPGRGGNITRHQYLRDFLAKHAPQYLKDR